MLLLPCSLTAHCQTSRDNRRFVEGNDFYLFLFLQNI
jgi:hypothetical protein